MVWTPLNSKGMKLVDSRGTEIQAAYEFDDETQEVKFYLQGKRPDAWKYSNVIVDSVNKRAVKCSVVVPGTKIVSKDNS